MDPDDRGYLFLRWLLRTRIVVFLGRYLPNFLVAIIGRRASRSSRDYTSTVKAATDEEVRAKIRTHANRVFSADSPFDILISGHVHVAEDSSEEFQGSQIRCINMGTWL
jgi:UDP-2,3-diacylglucosamine hydrolase